MGPLVFFKLLILVISIQYTFTLGRIEYGIFVSMNTD